MKKFNFIILLFTFFYSSFFYSLDLDDIMEFLKKDERHKEETLILGIKEIFREDNKVLDFRCDYFKENNDEEYFLYKNVVDLDYIYEVLPPYVGLKFLSEKIKDIFLLESVDIRVLNNGKEVLGYSFKEEPIKKKILKKDEATNKEKPIEEKDLKPEEKVILYKSRLIENKKITSKGINEYINFLKSKENKNLKKDFEDKLFYIKLQNEIEDNFIKQSKIIEKGGSVENLNLEFKDLNVALPEKEEEKDLDYYLNFPDEEKVPAKLEIADYKVKLEDEQSEEEKRKEEEAKKKEEEALLHKKKVNADYPGIFKFNKSFEYDFFIESVVDISEIYNFCKFSFYDRLVLKNVMHVMLRENIPPLTSNDLTSDYINLIINTDFFDVDEYLKFIKFHGVNETKFRMLMVYASIGASIERKTFPDSNYSKRDVYNYLISSNNHKVINTFNHYGILRVKFLKTDDKEVNFSSVQRLLEKIGSNEDFLKLYYSLEEEEDNIYIRFGTIDFPVEEFDYLREYFSLNVNNEVIGPIYKNNKISIIRVFDKDSKFSEQENLQLKVLHYFIKRNLFNNSAERELERDINIFKLKKTLSLLSKGESDTFMKKNCYLEFLNKDNSDPILFDSIKNLKKNGTTPILELDDGWHVLVVIGKEFMLDSDIYTEVVENIDKKCKKNYKREFINEGLDRMWYIV